MRAGPKQRILIPSFLWLVLGVLGLPVASAQEQVRAPACAGTWYPAEADSLRRLVESLLDAAPAPRTSNKPVAIIAPHAGYRFSAPTAAAAYRYLRGHTYRRVFVLAFSHRYAGAYRGIDVPHNLTAYRTPLGDVPVDVEVCQALHKHRLFTGNPEIGRQEHSLELQLPMLQCAIGEFRLVPLLIGQTAPGDYVAAAEAIRPWMDQSTLLVASSDFTHYGPAYGYQPFDDDRPAKLTELADKAAAPILLADVDGFLAHLATTGDTICGRGPITLLLRILSMNGGAEGLRAAMETSGQLTGDWTNSVTYQSFVFVPRPGTLDEAARGELLRLARQTVTAVLNGREPPLPDEDRLPPALRGDGACFVTLENKGELRGCIGNMVADSPLYRSVIRNATNACRDPRFTSHPVTAGEVPELRIEISYLTPLKRVNRPDEIVVGRHGLLISLGERRGVLLPQVAYERGWSREEFLAQTCRKAGLPPDAWKHPDARIDSFEAEVFGESEPATRPASRP